MLYKFHFLFRSYIPCTQMQVQSYESWKHRSDYCWWISEIYPFLERHSVKPVLISCVGSMIAQRVIQEWTAVRLLYISYHKDYLMTTNSLRYLNRMYDVFLMNLAFQSLFFSMIFLTGNSRKVTTPSGKHKTNENPESFPYFFLVRVICSSVIVNLFSKTTLTLHTFCN